MKYRFSPGDTSKLTSLSLPPESRHGAPQCSSSTYRTPPSAAAAPLPPTLPVEVDPATAANLLSRSFSSPSERSALMRFMVMRKLSAAMRKDGYRTIAANERGKYCLSMLRIGL